MVKKTRRLLIGGRRKKTRTKRGGTCETEEKHARLCKKKLHALENKFMEKDEELEKTKNDYNSLLDAYNNYGPDTNSGKAKNKQAAGKTKHFELRKGDSFGNIVDIYLTKYF